MKVIIHRGTHQIGGCVTEIQSSKGTRVIIDIGENLPAEDGRKLPDIQVEGLNKEGKNIDAIFVTHYHGDHIGMFNKISTKIPIYVGEVSKEIYKILQKRLIKAKKASEEDLKLIEKFRTYKIPKTVTIKDITVTPIEVDHSAFNSHMLLIECDGKRLLHTGDFRTHGPRGKAVIPALEKYVGQVDCLICEGTTLSRKGKTIVKETELEEKAQEIFSKNKNTFVMCSSTNIDRIAILHKAALKEGRLFVCDEYQKEMLMYIDSIAKSDLYKFKNKVLSYGENIKEKMEKMGFVMLVRPNSTSKKVMTYFPNHIFVYSQWEGYLDEKYKEQYSYMQEFVPKDYTYLHTSGHADYEAIKKVCKTVKPKIIIPIHGENPEAFKNMRTRRMQHKNTK